MPMGNLSSAEQDAVSLLEILDPKSHDPKRLLNRLLGLPLSLQRRVWASFLERFDFLVHEAKQGGTVRRFCV